LLADISSADQRANVYGLNAMTVGADLLPVFVIARISLGYLWGGSPFLVWGTEWLSVSLSFWIGLCEA
jgi:hypothetical protein